MDNDAQSGIRRENGRHGSTRELIYTPAEHAGHYAPLNRELHADDARQFGWVQENGTVQSYQHTGTGRLSHINGPSGQLYEQQKNPTSPYAVLNRVMGEGNHHALEPDKAQEVAQQQRLSVFEVTLHFVSAP